MTLDMGIARYLVAKGPPPDFGLPEAREIGYDYILAGNGLFKRARNRHFDALLLLAPHRVAGLPDLVPHVSRLFPSVPVSILTTALQHAQAVAADSPREAMYHLYLTRDRMFRLASAVQRGTSVHLAYQGGGDTDIILDLHSHHRMPAGFSATDDADEVGFRAYAVMGYIFTRPTLRLRVGVYGDFVEVPITTLFSSAGPFGWPPPQLPPRWGPSPLKNALAGSMLARRLRNFGGG